MTHQALRLATSDDRLARLVRTCRAFQSYVDALASTLPERAASPELYRELDRQVVDLMARLERVQHCESRPDGVDASASPSAVASAPPARVCDLAGISHAASVAELLAFLAGAGKSGVLWASTRSESFVLELASGALVHAAGERSPIGARILDELVRVKVLADRDATRLEEEARATGSSVRELALRGGFATTTQLDEAAARQAHALFQRLVASSDAIYRFREGGRLGAEEALELDIPRERLQNLASRLPFARVV